MNSPDDPISLTPSKLRRCAAMRADGEPCGADPQKGSDYCYMHDPKRARERTEARKRGGINRLSKLDSRSPRRNVSISSVRDVLGFLEEAIADLLQERPSSERARTLAYVSQAALKALEVGSFEERLSALEERTSGNNIRRIS